MATTLEDRMRARLLSVAERRWSRRRYPFLANRRARGSSGSRYGIRSHLPTPGRTGTGVRNEAAEEGRTQAASCQEFSEDVC